MSASSCRRMLQLSRQRGVAVITALLLTTLAITIVASLFWQQQVQVRSIENQRLQLQKQWVLRGALDWTRLILREDTTTVDHLGEPWAVPLAETRLDQYVENTRADTDIPDAALSGSIVDAQSRFNLTNLNENGEINAQEVAVFGRLLREVQENPALALATAEWMAAAQGGEVKPAGLSTEDRSSASRQITITHPDDLLAVPGFTVDALAKLKDFIVVLPKATSININTAQAEVLAARIDTLSLSEAAALVAGRENNYFRKTEELTQRLSGKSLSFDSRQLSTTTNYFLVNGNVRLNQAVLEMQALIERNGRTTTVIWIREH